jgi:hypothetical protein
MLPSWCLARWWFLPHSVPFHKHSCQMLDLSGSATCINSTKQTCTRIIIILKSWTVSKIWEERIDVIADMCMHTYTVYTECKTNEHQSCHQAQSIINCNMTLTLPLPIRLLVKVASMGKVFSGHNGQRTFTQFLLMQKFMAIIGVWISFSRQNLHSPSQTGQI